MKRFLLILAMLLMALPVWGADVKISELPAVTTTTPATDVVPVVATGATSKITINNLFFMPAPTGDNTWSGETILVTAAAGGLAAGDIVYLDGTGVATKAVATATTTMPAICIATAVIEAAATGRCLTRGLYKYPAAHSDFTVTGGTANLLYTSRSTAGAATSTIPTTSGDQVQVIGIALAADLALFNFNYMLVQVP